MRRVDVAIAGAGLAGLCAARALRARGIDCELFEASDDVGGRVRTDRAQGFLFDRGFQVLLTAYPECRSQLDYKALRLGMFHPGAQVAAAGRFWTVADPRRMPLQIFETLRAPIGGFADKLAVLRLVAKANAGGLDALFRRRDTTTLDSLRRLGFSNRMIDRFWRPFLGGIFLGRDLGASSRMMEFVIRMMSQGGTALPAAGMGAIPRQLAQAVPPHALHLREPVAAVDGEGLTLARGERIAARAVIVATDGPAAAALLGAKSPDPGSRPATVLYFAAQSPPVEGPWLVLNGERTGPVNNLCVPSEVCPSYAPPGVSLVSAVVLGDWRGTEGELVRDVRAQLVHWYGASAGKWEYLRHYRIRHAQPEQAPGSGVGEPRARMLAPGLFLCGDHAESASIHGAMRSGRRAAALAARWLRNAN
ncbi:MAG: NAD(P)/FAD-dependent oxidoreductase [Candidatus Sumerlaeia bacterium]|nr:NAD(P)/FAD-dependent oxidoreductase [Candidatus Sumerlaeia bacterium]